MYMCISYRYLCSDDVLFICSDGLQGRIQDFVLGGTKVGEGSGDRLRSPAGPGQNPGIGPPEAPGF